MAVGTKVLRLKRPRLFPVLDAFVAQMFGVSVPPDPTQADRIDIALELARAVRREGRENISVLRCVKQELHDDGIDRSLARIFDALIWFSYPVAGVAGAKRVIEVRLDPD